MIFLRRIPPEVWPTNENKNLSTSDRFKLSLPKEIISNNTKCRKQIRITDETDDEIFTISQSFDSYFIHVSMGNYSISCPILCWPFPILSVRVPFQLVRINLQMIEDALISGINKNNEREVAGKEQKVCWQFRNSNYFYFSV